MNALIRFTTTNRKTGARGVAYIKTVRYADGPGMRVTQMTTTRDRNAAASFAVENAIAVAVQFSQYPAALEKPNGTPLPEETARVQAGQAARRAAAQQITAEFNAAFAEACANTQTDLLAWIAARS